MHIDSCELRHADGKLVMFLAIDRVSKFTYVEFRNVVATFPHKIHTVLTDNGMAFADLLKNRTGSSRQFHEDLESLKAHVRAFVTAYNFAKCLKSLRWKTPFQTIFQTWIYDPDRFKIDPHQLIPGLYT